jgi:hypothetical protein
MFWEIPLALFIIIGALQGPEVIALYVHTETEGSCEISTVYMLSSS